MKYIMSLDQGTTSSRCILFDRSGNICASVQKEFRQIYPQPGWVEHDAEEIWDTTLEVSRAAMAKLGVEAKDIAAIGITNQRETTVIWDKATGEPIANAIVWQCRRTSDIIDGLIKDGYADTIRYKTGLQPDAYFSGSKIKWLLDNVPGARARAEAGELLFGTIDTWLIWKLTGGRVHVTDYTNASRTMLYNIRELCWDKELLGLLDVPECMLPEVKPSSCIYGFLLMNTGSEIVESRNGLVTTIAASCGDHVEYALEGSIFVGGAAVQWLRDELNVVSDAAETQQYAEKVPDTAGAYVVPAFTGLGAPYWNQRARGTVVGITRGFSRAHLVRATLESIAYQTQDITEAMERDSGIGIAALKVDGGACANNFLMQFQADIAGCSVYRPKCIETTALGAAYLAGLAVGYWESLEDVKQNQGIDRVFVPAMEKEKRTELRRGWLKAVKCAQVWAEE